MGAAGVEQKSGQYPAKLLLWNALMVHLDGYAFSFTTEFINLGCLDLTMVVTLNRCQFCLLFLFDSVTMLNYSQMFYFGSTMYVIITESSKNN